MMLRLIHIFIFLLALTSLSAQSAMDWINVGTDTNIQVEGQAWQSAARGRFDRLPSTCAELVRKELWNLSLHSSGLHIDFVTNSDSIVLRYGYGGKESMKNMSSVAVSGMDLYAQDKQGEWMWVQSKYLSFRSDTMSLNFSGYDASRVQRFRLYMPIHNTIKWFEIGKKEGTALTSVKNAEKPIVIYGTSIVHGLAASRAGMTWTSILGRKLTNPIVNLGFAGNGRMEKELIDVMVELDAAVFVIDCLPNLVVFAEDELRERVDYAIKTIRARYSNTPIVFAEHGDATINLLNDESQQKYVTLNKLFGKIMARHSKQELKNIYVLKASEIALDIDDTVDGIHPTDSGMRKYANAYYGLLQKIKY